MVNAHSVKIQRQLTFARKLHTVQTANSKMDAFLRRGAMRERYILRSCPSVYPSGYRHVIVINFAVCRDAARRAGSSATAELFVGK